MSENTDPPNSPPPDGAKQLASVQGKVEAARVLLARLLQEVVVAESLLRSSQAAQLLEANEQLVLTAVRNQGEADTAAQLLAEVSRSAELDALTQLPNRLLLFDRFARAIAAAKRHDRRLALLFLDLNNFKEVNDSLGHAAGDEVLKMVAHRLVTAVRDADTVSRQGGDEFVILLTEIAHPADAGHIADKLVAALAAPTQIGNQVLRLAASIGIAIYPDDGGDAKTLLQRADTAMYQAKRHRLGGMAFYDPQAVAHGTGAQPLGEALHDSFTRHSAVSEDQRRLHAELREANEQLVLAAVSAQELQAAAQRAHRQQAEFMSLAAQELANPLAPIRLAAAMLGRVQSPEPLLPRAKAIIEKQIGHMSRLVAAVQDASHAGRAAFHLERHPVDLVAVIGAAVDACRPAMDARLQTFTIQLPALPVRVSGEATRLKQAVRNLLDNASQYTPDLGQIQLTLTQKRATAELTVSDSGIGITGVALPTIFEPFARDIPALGLRAVGHGIGLTVVRTLVEAHRGTVSASSAGTGRGSQFTVSLPLAADAAKADAPA